LLWVAVTALTIAWLFIWLGKTGGFGPATVAAGLEGLGTDYLLSSPLSEQYFA